MPYVANPKILFGTHLALCKAQENKMKALKKALFTTTIGAIFMMLALGGYNSALIDPSAFVKNDLGIKLAKRLDEIRGEITIGRVAASIPTFKPKAKPVIKKQVAKLVKKKVVKKKKVQKKKEVAANIPAPVVNENLELSLTGGFHNKKALDAESEFSGSAVVRDGVVEEISVSLPGGQSFTINTNERMVGNVFQYEDTGTRERKSALFYKVKKGQYMVTLTDDTQFPGLRLEFRADNIQDLTEDIADNSNWALNKQNPNNNENTEDEYAQNELGDDEASVEPDFYQEAALDPDKASEVPVDQSTSYGFSF